MTWRRSATVTLGTFLLTTTTTSFIPTPAAFISTPNASRIAFTDSSPRSTSSSLNLFGSEPKIVYENLNHPASEMAAAAVAGEIPCKSKAGESIATFAGGCFWGLELAYQRVPGVTQTAVGYTQGNVEKPDYGAVCGGGTGHTEAVQVYFDESVVTFDELLDVFFNRVDPTTVNGQGNDRGTQYRTGVYTHGEAQMKVARDRFAAVGATLGNNFLGQPKKIASECLDAQIFWPAEGYHQQYLSRGGRGGNAQNAEKGCTDTIRCYG